MIRFRLELRPVADIEPWGSDHPHLHWFGLTDGWYWIELDGHELLRYSDQTVRRWSEAGDDVPHPYVDYQVVRLWEDVIALVPAACEPVPADCQTFIRSDPRDWRDPDDPSVMAAIAWYEDHVQYMSYLHNGPHIRWWRTIDGTADTITVSWRHQATAEIEFAAPPVGLATMPTTSFLAAVAELDRTLIGAMDKRIAELERDGPPPGVTIDMQRLRAEHEDRQDWLNRRLQVEPETDWPTIRAGATALLPPP